MLCTIYFSAMPIHRVSAASTTRYVAATGSDSGTCTSSAEPCRTIQYAVNQSSSGDRVLVAEGTYTYNAATERCSSLTTRAIVCVMDKSLSILGGYSTFNWWSADPVVNLTTIDGQSTYRGVAVIKSFATTFLDMEGFTIQNSRALGPASGAMGGGMLVQLASITLKDMVFNNNQAVGANTGAGAGGSADGGAIRIQDAPVGTTSLLQRVTFNNNQSLGGNGPDRGGIAFGALFIYNSTVTVEDSSFTNNLAQAGSTSGSGVSGLYADALGGGIAVQNSIVTLRRVTVTGNHVTGGNAGTSGKGGGAFGGGIFVEGTDNSFGTSITLTDSIVANNTATAGNANTGGNAAGGGFASDSCLVKIERTQIISNSALGGNSATGVSSGIGSGGGLNLFAVRQNVPRASLKNIVIADNFADQGSGTQGLGNGGGGGLNVQGIGLDITHATFARNRIGSGLVLGQALIVQPWDPWGTALPTDATLSYSVISDHTEGRANAAAIVVQNLNNISGTLAFNHGLFSGNEKDTNSDNLPVAHGTINGLSTMSTSSSVGYMSPGASNYNYHLRIDSVAKDQAIGSTTGDDLDKQDRPYNNISDFGADEYTPFPLAAGVGNGTLSMNWKMGENVLAGGLSYYEVVVTCTPSANLPDQGDCGQPINVGISTNLKLTGLSNFEFYTLIVYAYDASDVRIASSNTLTVFPSDIFSFLPLIKNYK